MIEIKGKYSNAIVFSDSVEPEALDQLQTLCNQAFCKDSKVRVMSDVHAGKGCVIGFTADLGEMVIPNIVGVDIGCGMLSVKLGKVDIDLKQLDQIVNQYIPSGREVQKGRFVRYPQLQALHCYRSLKDTRRLEKSIGTLGGGNHFIEVNIDDEDNTYLVIHSGSRNLGKQVAEYYQNLAFDIMSGKDKLFETQAALIKQYKKENRAKEIQSAIKQLHKEFEAKGVDIPKELCYLTGTYRDQYLDDMKICQAFATLNRKQIASTILDKMWNQSIESFEYFETIHNYIDLDSNMVRKGAVSAQFNEPLLIPINMRDGSLLCVGKGNAEWNYSAPHGAGRLYSRTKAKELFSLEAFEATMEGIYTTSINRDTLDECPMAYKEMDEIVRHLGDTATIVKVLKPIYNYKAHK